jgi:hypothetical protein
MIIVTVLVALIGVLAVGTGVLWDRWTDEIGEHQKTTGKAERAEASEKRANSERDELKQEVSDLRKENSDLKKWHPILEFYGPRAKYMASYDLKKEIGHSLRIGKCPEVPCFVFTMKDMGLLSLGIAREDMGFNPEVGTIGLRLKQGCKAVFTVDAYEVTFVIEADHIEDVRAGIGISLLPVASIQRTVNQVSSGCPKE